MTSDIDTPGWDVTGNDETLQTALKEINLTAREKIKADRDAKMEEKRTALEARKAEMEVQRAKRQAEKDERIKDREAQKAEKLKQLGNEVRASELQYMLENTKVLEESEIKKKTIDTETQKVMKGLEIQELGIVEDYKLNTLKVTELSELYKKSMDMGMTKMKQDHELAMADMQTKRQIMTENLGALKKIQFKSRGASQYLSHMNRETSRTTAAVMMANGRDQLAIGNDARLALKGPGSQSSLPMLTNGESGEAIDISPAGNDEFVSWETEVDADAYTEQQKAKLDHEMGMTDAKLTHEKEMKNLEGNLALKGQQLTQEHELALKNMEHEREMMKMQMAMTKPGTD